MMKRTLVVVSLVCLTGIAHAKNVNSWTGVYGGLNAGGIFNTAYIKSNNLGFTRPDGTCDTNANFASFFPGVQLGYARQFNNRVVLGLEADYTNNVNKQGNANCTCDVTPTVSDKFVVKNQQQGSLRGRIGYAFNNHWLPFVTAGGSVAGLGVNYRDEGGDYYSMNGARAGWLVGAGVEWRFAQSWSIRTEYYYIAYNNALKMGIPVTYGLNDPNGKARVNLNANNVRAAINYWF